MAQKRDYATKKKGKTEVYPFWNLEDIKNVVEWLDKNEEQVKQFHIGEHRLRHIISEDYECKYHLMIGRVIRIKTTQFDEYLAMVKEL